MTRFRHFQKLALKAQTPENAYLPLRQDGYPKNPAHVRSKGNFSFLGQTNGIGAKETRRVWTIVFSAMLSEVVPVSPSYGIVLSTKSLQISLLPTTEYYSAKSL